MILAFCVYAACLWSSLTPQQAPHIGFLLPYGPRPEGNKTKTGPNTKQGNQGVAKSLSYTQLKEPSLQQTSCTCYHWYLMHHSMYSSTVWLNERRPAELARNNFNLPAAQLVKHITAHCFDGLCFVESTETLEQCIGYICCLTWRRCIGWCISAQPKGRGSLHLANCCLGPRRGLAKLLCNGIIDGWPA